MIDGGVIANSWIAFQIRDDVLDATATRTDLGKPTGHDEIMGRPSLLQVTELTPEAANRRAERQSAAAIEAISSVEVADERFSAHLKDLAQFVVERER